MKKKTVYVTDRVVKNALDFMKANVFSYNRKPCQGVLINGVRYAL